MPSKMHVSEVPQYRHVKARHAAQPTSLYPCFLHCLEHRRPVVESISSGNLSLHSMVFHSGSLLYPVHSNSTFNLQSNNKMQPVSLILLEQVHSLHPLKVIRDLAGCVARLGNQQTISWRTSEILWRWWKRKLAFRRWWHFESNGITWAGN